MLWEKQGEELILCQQMDWVEDECLERNHFKMDFEGWIQTKEENVIQEGA